MNERSSLIIDSAAPASASSVVFVVSVICVVAAAAAEATSLGDGGGVCFDEISPGYVTPWTVDCAGPADRVPSAAARKPSHPPTGALQPLGVIEYRTNSTTMSHSSCRNRAPSWCRNNNSTLRRFGLGGLSVDFGLSTQTAQIPRLANEMPK